jgi:hypothetical protein
MLDEDVTCADILVIDVNKWSHKDNSLRLFLSGNSQEVYQPLVGK